MSIRLRVRRGKQFRSAIKAAQRALDSPDTELAVAKEIADKARGFAPVKTGRLRASIRAMPTASDAKVVAMTPYSTYVHWGSIHNPRPVPFLVLASYTPEVHEVAERVVEKAFVEAGL